MFDNVSAKLSHELDQLTSQTMLIPIREYLLKACQDNHYLAEQILTEARTLSLCDRYIQAEARKLLDGRSGYIADDIVYGMAEDFYYLSDEEIAKLTKPKAPPKAAEKKPAAPSAAKPDKKTAAAQTDQLSLFDPALADQPTESALADQANDPALAGQSSDPALVDQSSDPVLADRPAEDTSLADPEPILSEEDFDHEQEIA